MRYLSRLIAMFLCVCVVMLPACATDKSDTPTAQPTTVEPSPTAEVRDDIFDFSLADCIQTKTEADMLAILGLSEADIVRDRSAVTVGKAQFGGCDFDKVLSFSVFANAALDGGDKSPEDVDPCLESVSYVLTLPEGDAATLGLINDVYSELVAQYGAVGRTTVSGTSSGSSTHSFDNSLNDAVMPASGEIPQGTAIWRHPDSVENLISMKVAYDSAVGYTITVSVQLDRYIIRDRNPQSTH